MDYLFTRQQIRAKIYRLAFWVLGMWLVYVAYQFYNEYLNTIREQSEFWRYTPVRFLFREIVVYFFGFLGFLFLKKEGLNPSYYWQLWLLLAVLDMLCLSIGAFRQGVMEVKFLHDSYNRLMGIIASPVYAICFIIYALYFSMKPPHETSH
jgi:hypothetical protein